jgi:hypothetical protein
MSDAITWHNGVDRFDANPTATAALDRARWETLGARFVEVDDGDDETPGLAVGQVDGLDFGVLDYGETETFLLLVGEVVAGPATARLLKRLEEVGVLEVDRDVTDLAGARRPAPDAELRARLAEVENRLARLEVQSHQSVISASFAWPAVLGERLRREEWSFERAGQLRLVNVPVERDEIPHPRILPLSGFTRRLLEPAAAPPATSDEE